MPGCRRGGLLSLVPAVERRVARGGRAPPAGQLLHLRLRPLAARTCVAE
jgi:hypothetical protein